MRPPGAAFSPSDKLRKFIQPLRNPVLGGIPLAVADTTRQAWWQPGVTHYTIDIGQFTDQLHPDLPNPTRLWGFGRERELPAPRRHHRRKARRPIQITFRNNLPPTHIIPVDPTVMGTEAQDNRAVHLHGGLVPWTSDGGPFAWWDPAGHHGPTS